MSNEKVPGLKIVSVAEGIMPFGPGAGADALLVDFESSPVENYDKDTFDPVAAAQTLHDTFLKMVEDAGLQACLQEVYLNGRHIYFAGDALANKENIDLSNQFLRAFSRPAVKLQQTAKLENLRPPFMAWIGHPVNYTGREAFYENFNFIVVMCSVSKDMNKDNLQKYYIPFAMVELGNHTFSIFIVPVRNADDIDIVQKYYLDEGVLEINPQRIFALPTFEKGSNSDANLKAATTAFEACAQLSATAGFRVGASFEAYVDSPKVLKMGKYL